MPGVRRTVGLAMPLQDIGQLEAGAAPIPGHGRSAGRDDLQSQTVERAPGRADRVGRDLGVARRRESWLWPSRTWMIRMSVPLSKRCVAKLWRKVCSVTRLVSPAALTADRHAACSTVGWIG